MSQRSATDEILFLLEGSFGPKPMTSDEMLRQLDPFRERLDMEPLDGDSVDRAIEQDRP